MSGTTTVDSTTITFSEIPYDWRVPSNFMEVRPNYSSVGLQSYPARALIIADMSNVTPASAPGLNRTAPTAVVGQLYNITRDDQAPGLFGAGSMAARLVAAFRAANTTTPLDVLPVAAPAGGTARMDHFTFAGTVTSPATLPFSVAGTRVPVYLAAGDGPGDVVSATVTAINSNPALGWVAGASGTGGVTLGLAGLSSTAAVNDVITGPAVLDGDVMTPGITVAGASTPGVGVADITGALSAVSADAYTAIIVPSGDLTTYGLLATEMARRYAATGKLDCHAYMGFAGNLSATIAQGVQLNSPHVTVFCGWSMPSSIAEAAAASAGVCAFYLAQDPARQLRGLPVPGAVAPLRAFRWNPQEMDQLLRSGMTPFDVLSDGTVVMTRVVTTYQRSPLGTLDTAWLDIMVPHTMSRIRYDWLAYLSLRWPRPKLADDDSVAAEYDPEIATPKRVKGSWATRCTLYEQQGWIENVDALLADTYFVRDPSDRNRLNSRQPVNEVGNLMVFAGALEFAA